jgi:prolyl-tRNA editing enzyme YbaK/EbsC (Cys-tRNA(Pro) deacylase)
MSVETVRDFFTRHAPDIEVIELDGSTATVALAAAGHGVSPGQIAKTLSLKVQERNFLVVTRGDARLDNKKAKARFGGKVTMLGPDEVLAVTGHAVGGVCPFGLASPLPIFCDVSLRDFEEVVPAAGSTHSAVKIAPARMVELVNAEWVDVCKSPGEQSLEQTAE